MPALLPGRGLRVAAGTPAAAIMIVVFGGFVLSPERFLQRAAGLPSGRSALLGAVAALALADASIVTLALPSIVAELGASVEQAGAVLGSYTLALAVALPAGEALRRRAGARVTAGGGLAVFAAASLACGLAGSVGALLALRAVQAAGAAAVLAGAFELLDAARRGRTLWTAAAVFGVAIGPALGGALTELLDWRAIFLLQAPVAAVAALALPRGATARRGSADAGAPRRAAPRADAGAPRRAAPRADAGAPRRAAPPADSRAVRDAVALGLVSAALTGVLFLLVLLLVTGWSLSPLAAAAAMSVLPLAAIAGARIPGAARVRAPVGAALVAGGVGMLAFVPSASVAWVVVPQIVAGVGMGLALPALAGGLLPERTPGEAARLLTIRHAGITLALALLAPLAAAQLDQSVEATRERGAALVLDARLPPLDKFALVEAVVADIDPVDPRGQLAAAFDRAPVPDDPEARAARAELVRRTDETLIAGVREAFAPTFLACAALALLGCGAALPGLGAALRRGATAAAAAAVLVGGAALAGGALAPEPVRIADPCAERQLPGTGGIDGIVQDVGLRALDEAACEIGSSREELALALVDQDAARAYEKEHGVDPRSLGDLLRAVLGGGGTLLDELLGSGGP